jgi:P4 family phage/plasmid primase-like protien
MANNNQIRLVKSKNVKRTEEKDKKENIITLDYYGAIKMIEQGETYYEYFDDNVITKVYFDVERDDYTNEVSEDEKDDIMNACIEKIAKMFERYPQFDPSQHIAIAERHRWTLKNKYKVSFRFYITLFKIRYSAIKTDILKDVGEIPVLNKTFDPMVYGNKSQLLGCIYNHKEDYPDHPLTPITEHATEDFIAQYLKGDEILIETNDPVVVQKKEKKEVVVKKEPVSKKQSEDPNDYEYGKAKKLVKILRNERADTYQDWIKVGWCLRNIDDRLYDDWIAFSQKSAKFDENECNKVWNGNNKGVLGMGTLHFWAKNDNLQEYEAMKKDELMELIKKASSGTEYDVALVVEKKYEEEFVYSPESKTWFKFENHRWKPLHGGLGLKKRLPTSIAIEFRNVASYLMSKANNPDIDAEERERIDAMNTKLLKVICSLKKPSFQKGIMEECELLFMKDNFEKELDTKPNLIGFENGVFDLDTHEFRDGRPDDMITSSTKYDYTPMVNSVVKGRIMEFMTSIQDTIENRDYLLLLCAMMLHGIKKHHLVVFWIGQGGNGKGMLSLLLRGMFGDYMGEPSVELYTTKRGNSSQANPEMYKCKGKRCIISAEPEKNDTIYVGKLKNMSGGDKIEARALYQGLVEFDMEAYPVIQTNDKPKLSGTDVGVKRRFRLVRFPYNFVYPDKVNQKPNNKLIDINLEAEFKDVEYQQQMMLLLLEIYENYRLSGYQVHTPERIEKETLEYLNENNHIMNFLDEMYEVAPDEVTDFIEAKYISQANMVFKDYKEWAKKSGVAGVPRQGVFYEELLKELQDINSKCEIKVCKDRKSSWRNINCVYGIRQKKDENECMFDREPQKDDYDF